MTEPLSPPNLDSRPRMPDPEILTRCPLFTRDPWYGMESTWIVLRWLERSVGYSLGILEVELTMGCVSKKPLYGSINE